MMAMEMEEDEVKEWEEIIDFTLEEDSAEVKITTDKNGNSFSLSEAIVITKLMPVSGNTSELLVKIGFNQSSIGNLLWHSKSNIIGSSPRETETYRMQYLHVKSILGKIHTICSYQSYNATSVKNSLNPLSTTGYGVFMLDEDLDLCMQSPINMIDIGSYTKCMGVGTRIKVIGIRE